MGRVYPLNFGGVDPYLGPRLTKEIGPMGPHKDGGFDPWGGYPETHDPTRGSLCSLVGAGVGEASAVLLPKLRSRSYKKRLGSLRSIR
jgi:hypothetical protein